MVVGLGMVLYPGKLCLEARMILSNLVNTRLVGFDCLESLDRHSSDNVFQAGVGSPAPVVRGQLAGRTPQCGSATSEQ